MCSVTRNGKYRQVKNLRAVAKIMNELPIDLVTVYRDGLGGSFVVTFSGYDGYRATADFASYNLMIEWLRRRVPENCLNFPPMFN